MMCSSARPFGWLAVVLTAAACGQGSVRLGQDTDAVGVECPQLVVSTDTLDLQDAYFDLGNQASVEIDNRCAGTEPLVLSGVQVDGDASVFSVPEVDFEVEPGARLTLEFGFLPTAYGTFTSTVTYQTNDPANPTVSFTLTGRASPDQDGDGFEAIEVGGSDCDDADTGVYPGREERDDGVDQDCDGLVDEDFLRPGDVMLTEVFALPSASPRQRQWFEVRNASSRTINLVNWTLSSAELDLVIDQDAVVPPGGTAVLARSADPELVGLPRRPTAVLSGSDELMTLVGGWELTLAAGTNPVYVLEGDGFPRFQEGYSLQLDPTIDNAFESTRGDRWCQADVEMPTGELGTPFDENTWCPQIDHDGDGTPLSGDCDDADPDRSPDAREVLDGIDNDCDGKVDQLSVPGSETAEITGMPWDRWWSFGAGDFNDDGFDELVMVAANARRTYVVELDGVTGGNTFGSVTSQERTVFGADPIVSSVAPEGRDVDGDKVDDIVMGTGTFTTGPGATGLLVSTDGDLDSEIALTLNATRTLASSRSGVATLDTDGDGVYEVLVGLGAGSGGAGQSFLVDLDGVAGTVPFADVSEQTLRGADRTFDAYGVGVAAGDLDDDGYEDTIVREGGRFSSAGAEVFLMGGGASPGSSGVVDDVADTVLGGAGAINTTFPSRRPLLGDIDGDGTLDLAVPSSTSVHVWFDTSDLLTTRRGPDTEIVAVGAGILCAADMIDQDGDGEDGLVVSWTDAAWGGVNEVAFFSTETLASAGGALSPARDADGGVTSAAAADGLGCGLFASDTTGGPGEELFVVAPQRRVGSTFNATLWLFEAQ